MTKANISRPWKPSWVEVLGKSCPTYLRMLACAMSCYCCKALPATKVGNYDLSSFSEFRLAGRVGRVGVGSVNFQEIFLWCSKGMAKFHALADLCKIVIANLLAGCGKLIPNWCYILQAWGQWQITSFCIVCTSGLWGEIFSWQGHEGDESTAVFQCDGEKAAMLVLLARAWLKTCPLCLNGPYIVEVLETLSSMMGLKQGYSVNSLLAVNWHVDHEGCLLYYCCMICMLLCILVIFLFLCAFKLYHMIIFSQPPYLLLTSIRLLVLIDMLFQSFGYQL